MFDFLGLKTIFKYNWSKIFEDVLPKGNETVMEKKDHDNVVTGVILVAIGKILFYLIAVFVLDLISNEIIDADKVYGFNFRSTFQTDLLIFAFPVVVLLCEFISYKNKQNSYLPLCFSLWGGIAFAYCMFLILVWFYIFSKTFTVPFVGFVSTILEMIGYLFVITGYLEFARKNKQQYIEDNKPPEKESLIKTSAIGIDDVAMHSKRSCEKCKAPLDIDTRFCGSCGAKVE